MEQTTTTDLLVSYDDVESAAARLDGASRITPVVTSRLINEHTGADVFFKCENLQNTGSFKFRGAYNALSKLRATQKCAGVLSYSSGNHAQALARAGQLLGVPVTIIMPDDAPSVKKAATRGYGAEVIEYDKNETTREELAQKLSRSRGLPIIPPYNHPDIVAGQGTAVRELMLSENKFDLLLVCCGGGGLLSGSAIAATALQPDCRIVGVEPSQADDAARSFRSGTIQSVHNPETIADGARTPSLGSVTFPIIRQYVDDFVTVSDDQIYRAMIFLTERTKLAVEPTGALAFSALFSGAIDAKGTRVGVVISGGNIDLEALPRIRSAAGC